MHTRPDPLSEITQAVQTVNHQNSDKEKENNQASVWVPYKDLLINSQYLKYGLVLVSPKHDNPIKNMGKTDSFFVKDREFFFHIPHTASKTGGDNASKANLPDSRSMKRAKTLLSKLTNFASAN